MQNQRDILELCFNDLTHDRNTLRNLSSMAPRTFQRNMKKLENGERLGRKLGSGRPRLFSDSERQKISEFPRSNPLSSSSKLKMQKSIAKLWMSLFLTQTVCILIAGSLSKTVRHLTMEFFEEKNLQFLQWPPNSPDVNPIENVWEILKNAVEQKNPKNKQELIEAIQNSKSVITREISENLMNSVGKRLKSCKRLQGELISSKSRDDRYIVLLLR